MSHELIPDNIITLIEKNLTVEESTLVLDEIQNTIKLESVLPPLVDKGKTYGDWATSTMGIGTMFDHVPSEALPLDIVKQMLKSAPVRFALEMKRASIVSVFRNKRSWKVHSPDAELAEVITANLQKILPKMALDFSFSSLAYGVSFQELVWENKNKYELGITNSKYQTNRKFVVAKIPNSVNPATVKQINRTKDGHFNGFVQRGVDIFGKDIVVSKDASLIIPYDEKFRNLWGESLLRPIYPIWVWYEIVLRAMVKYMERTGTPVAVVKAPSRATIFKPGTKEKVDGISWGMEIASNVSRSNAISIPSDTDDKGKPLWELEYLNSSERSQPFLDILELLTQMILRAGLSADRALSQSSGGTGSYAIGRVHQEATAIHNEMVLIQWIHYLNMYFLPLYSLYNRGENGPPVWLETQGLDPKDSENLATMLGIAQGMESFKEAGYRIDWNTLLEVNNIPLLTTADADAAKRKHQEEALSNQENMLSLQSKFSTPSPTKNDDGSLKANLPNKAPEPKDDDSKKKLEFNTFLQNPEWEEVLHKRDSYGKFSSKAESGFLTSKNMFDSIKNNLTDAQIEQFESMFNQYDSINFSDLSASEKDFLTSLPYAMELFNKDMSIDLNETFDDLKSEFEAMGLDIKAESARAMNEDELKKFPFAGGIYDEDTNTILLNPKIVDAGKDKTDIRGLLVLSHEMLHSNQEVDRALKSNEINVFDADGKTISMQNSIFDSNNLDEIQASMGMSEGQNELLNRYILSNKLGVPLTDKVLKTYESIKRIGDEDYNASAYNLEVGFYAKLLDNESKRTSRNPLDILIEQHNSGFDMAKNRDFLKRNYKPYNGTMKSALGYYNEFSNSGRRGKFIESDLLTNTMPLFNKMNSYDYRSYRSAGQ